MIVSVVMMNKVYKKILRLRTVKYLDIRSPSATKKGIPYPNNKS